MRSVAVANYVRRTVSMLAAIGAVAGGMAFGATPPASALEDGARVWSVAVEIDTGTGTRSATSLDKQAYIRLSDTNITWLDDPFTDLNPGGQDRYDLVLDGVRTLADIRRIEIGIPRGTYKDACIRSVRVFINGALTVRIDPTTCRWLFLDAEREFTNPITISGASLRAAWAALNPPRPSTLSTALLSGQLNTAVGHWAASNNGIVRTGMNLHADETIGRRVTGAVHVTSTVNVLVRGLWRTVAVDQDVRLACRSGIVSVTTANVAISGLSTWDQLAGLTERVRSTIDTTLRAGMQSVPAGTCPPIVVATDGSITI